MKPSLSPSSWRRYLLALPAGFALGAGLYLLAFYGQLDAPVYEAGSISNYYAFKVGAAHAITQPKILILSGSNGHFGVSAAQLQQKSGRPAVNLAVFAGLSSDYLLWTLQKVARPGDTVLLPLEYNYYQDLPFSGELYLSYIIGNDAAYIRSRPWRQKLDIILKTRPSRLWLGYFSRLFPSIRLPRQGFLDHLNAQGDEKINEIKDITPVQRASLKKFSAFVVGEYSANNNALRALEQMASWCQENHVTLLATYPAFLTNPHYQEPAYQDFFRFIRDFWTRQNVPLLGTPEDFFYPADDMFDTEYHLNAPARVRRTETLWRLLQPHLPPVAPAN
jgi:hypothetical protein